MLFCHIYIGSFAHERIRHIGMYFPRYLLGSILTAFFAVVIKYLGKYLTIRLILSCAKEHFNLYESERRNYWKNRN